MAADVAPELLERIREDFLRILGEARLQAETWEAAGNYAEQVGQALSAAFRNNLGELPDGKMYWNIADRVVRPLLAQDHKLVADAAELVQTAVNHAAGVGLKAQRAPLDPDKVDGILQRLAAAEKFEDIAWILGEPVITFSRAVVDETIRRNVEFQGKAGMAPRVIRRAERKCCKWCRALAGEYEYPGVPRDVYRRHEACRCAVEYKPSTKRTQNVWTKIWQDDKETLERRRSAEGVNTKPRKP